MTNYINYPIIIFFHITLLITTSTIGYTWIKMAKYSITFHFIYYLKFTSKKKFKIKNKIHI